MRLFEGGDLSRGGIIRGNTVTWLLSDKKDSINQFHAFPKLVLKFARQNGEIHGSDIATVE